MSPARAVPAQAPGLTAPSESLPEPDERDESGDYPFGPDGSGLGDDADLFLYASASGAGTAVFRTRVAAEGGTLYARTSGTLGADAAAWPEAFRFGFSSDGLAVGSLANAGFGRFLANPSSASTLFPGAPGAPLAADPSCSSATAGVVLGNASGLYAARRVSSTAAEFERAGVWAGGEAGPAFIQAIAEFASLGTEERDAWLADDTPAEGPTCSVGIVAGRKTGAYRAAVAACGTAPRSVAPAGAIRAELGLAVGAFDFGATGALCGPEAFGNDGTPRDNVSSSLSVAWRSGPWSLAAETGHADRTDGPGERRFGAAAGWARDGIDVEARVTSDGDRRAVEGRGRVTFGPAGEIDLGARVKRSRAPTEPPETTCALDMAIEPKETEAFAIGVGLKVACVLAETTTVDVLASLRVDASRRTWSLRAGFRGLSSDGASDFAERAVVEIAAAFRGD